jgi:hypothetical protein
VEVEGTGERELRESENGQYGTVGCEKGANEAWNPTPEYIYSGAQSGEEHRDRLSFFFFLFGPAQPGTAALLCSLPPAV